jgi:Zn finger protein HypA/HybF involved in hydrogenase expression
MFIVDINKHSVYTHCWNCGSIGINNSDTITCGDCGSLSCSRYYSEEDLEFGLKQRKKDRELKKKSQLMTNEMD